jgi:hypothetical protein
MTKVCDTYPGNSRAKNAHQNGHGDHIAPVHPRRLDPAGEGCIPREDRAREEHEGAIQREVREPRDFRSRSPAVMGENRELSSIGQKRKKKRTSEMQCRRDG